MSKPKSKIAISHLSYSVNDNFHKIENFYHVKGEPREKLNKLILDYIKKLHAPPSESYIIAWLQDNPNGEFITKCDEWTW